MRIDTSIVRSDPRYKNHLQTLVKDLSEMRLTCLEQEAEIAKSRRAIEKEITLLHVTMLGEENA